MTELAALHAKITGDDSGLKAAIASSVGLVDRFSKSAEKSAAIFQRAFAQSEKAVDRLRQQIDPLYAASKRYEAAVATLDAALKRGALSQEKYNRLLDQAGTAYLTSGGAARRAVGSLSRYGGAAQMVGFQIADFATQVAAGTSATTAFAQQGSQLLGFFGPYGAVAGAALAVTIPLAAAYWDMAASAEAAAANAERLKTAQESLAQAQRDAQAAIDKAIYGVDEAYQVELLKEQVRLQKERQAVYDEMVRTAATFGNDERARNQYIADTMVKIGQIEASYAKISADLSAQQNRAAQLAIIEGQRAQHAAEVVAQTNLAKAAADALESSMANAYAVYARTRGEATALANETARAAAAFAAAQQRIADAGKVYGKIGARGDPRTANQQGYGQFGRPTIDETIAGYSGSAGGGGGGGGGEIEQLRKSLLTKEQLQLESYARTQEALRSALEQRLITQQEYAAMMEAAEAQHANAMYTIKQQEADMVRGAAQGMYGALGDLLGQFSGQSKAAAIAQIGLNKALAYATIVQNTAAAKMRALAELGPVKGAAAAAKIGLYGNIQKAIVAATGLAQAAGAGGGGGASGGGGTAASIGQPEGPMQVSLNTFGDGDFIRRSDLGSLLIDLNKAAGNRGYTILTPA